MTTTQRKLRERQAREALILDVAARMVVERGYLGMNMDRIAEEAQYSKGTIYQHFTCKEDVLSALAERTAADRVDLFRRAATFRGRPRERMAVLGLSLDLFVALHPTHVVIEQIVTADSIQAKTSEVRRTSLQEKEVACMSIAAGLVRDGMAAGDLSMPEDSSPEALVFGLWMLTCGGLQILTGKPELAHLGFGDASSVLRRHQNAILDGYGWAPLTRDWDYEATRRRALEEVFPDEARRADLQ